MNFRRRTPAERAAEELARREDPYTVTNASRIYFLPNLMTAGNLFCGFMAIVQCIQARLAETATGRPWEQLFLSRVAFPAGMADTAYADPSTTGGLVGVDGVTTGASNDIQRATELARNQESLTAFLHRQALSLRLDDTDRAALRVQWVERRQKRRKRQRRVAREQLVVEDRCRLRRRRRPLRAF